MPALATRVIGCAAYRGGHAAGSAHVIGQPPTCPHPQKIRSPLIVAHIAAARPALAPLRPPRHPQRALMSTVRGSNATGPSPLAATGMAGGGHTDVSVTDAAARLAAGTPYLDVRTPDEYAAGHPAGAANAAVMLAGSPNPDFVAAAEACFPDKDADLLVGCQSGKRSLVAVDQLAQAGYTKLYNVEGGYLAWSANGLPVE